MFFFEKKNQKTFATWVCGAAGAAQARSGAKVFCFFFSKKKSFFLQFEASWQPAKVRPA
jgi:hypothetical protein